MGMKLWFFSLLPLPPQPGDQKLRVRIETETFPITPVPRGPDCLQESTWGIAQPPALLLVNCSVYVYDRACYNGKVGILESDK